MRTKIELVILLLQIIKCNGNANNLYWSGYSYSNIIDALDKLIIKGYVEIDNNKHTLTPKGKKYLDALNKKLGRKGLYKFISPELRYRTKKIKVDEIYVPLRYKRE